MARGPRQKKLSPSGRRNDRVGSAPSVDWPLDLYRVLKAFDVRQASYVPDAGHTRLIELLHADPDINTTVLTTEEEGIALSAGAWLGGQRSALLLQSSGVGNCVNMLSLMATCRFPLLALVTMRGEWREFNPWQLPMGGATPGVLSLMGVKTVRVESAQDVAEATASAATLAFDSDQQMAVLLSQRMIGAKRWVEK
jgi:sulfopyruvate decarboxylase alpha subunit